MTSPHRLWRVTCSCGYQREATSAWAATAIFRLHVKTILGARELPQHLVEVEVAVDEEGAVGAREEEHTLAIEEPPREEPPSGQLPLV